MKLVNKSFGNDAEELSEASHARQACIECSLHTSCDEPFMKPYMPRDWNHRFLFVIEVTQNGEAAYVADGIPLAPHERLIIKRCLDHTDLTSRDITIIPVLRCRPHLSGSRKPKMVSLRACRPFLIKNIIDLNADINLLFGEACIKAFMNAGTGYPVAAVRGRELPMAVHGVKVAPHAYATVSVKSLVVDPHAATRLIEDLRKFQSAHITQQANSFPHKATLLGFDTEYMNDKVFTVGVASTAKAIAVSPRDVVLPSLLSPATLVGHNVAVDIEALIRQGHKGITKALEIWLQGHRLRDTLLESRLADENRGKHGYKLESLATALLPVKDWKGPTEAIGPDSSKWPPALRDERCRLDAWATLMIHNKLQDTIEGPCKLAHEIAFSLRRMYWAGVFIDKTKFAKLRVSTDASRAQSLASLMRYAKKFGLKDFSPTKDECLREYVYSEKGVGLQEDSYTKGGLPSVSVKVLKEYKDEKPIQALLSFSKFEKLRTTYGENILTKCQSVGNRLWMPVIINALAAKTGRRTSAAPNFQNWPVVTRQIVVSRFKKGSIADNDYSKLEPIVGGWVAKEPRLTDYFVKYPNGYIKIGEEFFKKTVEKNTKEYTSIKALVLAIIYNKKKWSFAEDLWVNQEVKLAQNYRDHEDKAGELLNSFIAKLFPGIRSYHEVQEHTVLSTGKVYNVLGQCRRLPLPLEPPRSEIGAYKVWLRYKAHVINQAINYPIQSLAAYITGCGLVDLERAFLSRWKHTYVEYHQALMEKKWPHMPLLCIEVHDDLVQDIPHGLEKKTKEVTHEIMTKPPSLVAALPELFDSNVKLTVDTNIAPCWGMKQ